MPRKIKDGPTARTIEKSQLILNSAMEEFLAQGYSAASMDRISTHAGVSKATIYSHFQDKETLYCALIEMMATNDKLAFSLDSAPAPGSVSMGEHVRAITEALINPVDGCDPNDDLIRFMRIIIAESGRFPQLARTFVEKAEKPASVEITKYLTACGVPEDEAEPLSWIISGTIVYHILITTMMNGADLMPMERTRLIGSLCALVEKYDKN